MSQSPKSGSRPMLAAVLAALGASACCVGPLVLVSLGIGGAWIANLTALEPYRPVFVIVTLVFLFLAFRKLYLVPATCEADAACAVPATRRNQRLIFWAIAVLVLALLAFPWYGTVFFE